MRWPIGIAVFCLVYSPASAACADEKCLQIPLRSLVVNVAEKKAIYCKGTNISPEDMEWISPNGSVVHRRSSKNNRVYVEGREDKQTGKGLLVLIIFSLQLVDNGNWTCKAKEGDLVEYIDVIVGEKATVDADEVKSINASKNAKLTCTTKGIPTPTVQWYDKDMQLIEKNRDPRYVITQQPKHNMYTLEIRNVDYQDSGKYICKVTQKKLTHYVHKTITLEVAHAPVIFDPETQRPVEVSQSKDRGEAYALKEVFAVINETKIITCCALSNPSPTFHWYIKGLNSFDTLIKDEDMITHDDYCSNLTISVKNEEDTNKFKCTASNNRGKAALVYHIRLGEKPNPPDDIAFVSANHTFLNFDVTCSNCTLFDKKTEGIISPDPTNLPIKGYIFELVPHQEGYPPDWENSTAIQVEIENPNITIFSVGPLANGTTYHVRVRSMNDAGFSTWLEMASSWLEKTKTDDATRLANTVLLLATALFLVMYF